MKWTSAMLWSLIAITPAAAEQSVDSGRVVEAVVERYLAAIEAQDWHTMQTLLADTARYRDPTMTHFGVPEIDLVGPTAIVDFWRRSSADSGTLSIAFERDAFYLAGPNAVLQGKSAVVVTGAAWNLPLAEISTRFPLISHFRIEAGKVTHHTDMVDYATAERQIVEQVERYNRQHGTKAVFATSPVTSELLTVAESYLEALHRDEWQTVARWLNAESTYLNFTAEAIGGSVERADGAEAMLAMFRRARENSGTRQLEFDVERSFVGGSSVVLTGSYRATVEGRRWGSEGATVDVVLPLVVLIRCLDRSDAPARPAETHVIVEHVEWMDYATGLAAMGTTGE